jgi:WD40 repeat protein
MRLPDLVAYQAAVQHPATAFADTDLRAATVATDRLGLPRAVAGNFAVTYQLRGRGREWAVRCFHRDSADRETRYAAISQTLASVRGGPFVPIAYLPSGVRVGQVWYPVTKMRWLAGRPLNRAIEVHLSNPPTLAELERRFVEMITEMRGLGFAHGDLQHGNILVDSFGALQLVDYDGIYVPALRGLAASEAGDPNYQHPGRAKQFDPDLDRFAALVIVVALRALREVPGLWATYNSGDNLLFRRADFLAPYSSDLFRDLQRLPNTGCLAERLAHICVSDYTRLPLLDDFLNGAPPASLLAGPVLRRADVTTLNRLYGSRAGNHTRTLPTGVHSASPTRRSWLVRRVVPQAALAFTPDGAFVATADRNGKLRLQDAKRGRVVRSWSIPVAITAIVGSPDGRLLAAAGVDGFISVSSLEAGTNNSSARLACPSGVLSALAFSPDGLVVAVAGTGSAVALCDVVRLRTMTLMVGRAGPVCRLAFSTDGQVLAVGYADGALRCWSVAGARLLIDNAQSAPVGALALSRDGHRVASSGGRGRVYLWNVPGGRADGELVLPVSEPVVRLAFAPRATRLAAAGESGRLVVWDLQTKQVTHDLPGSGAGVSDLAFSPDEHWLASTTTTGAVALRALRLPTQHFQTGRAARKPPRRQVQRGTISPPMLRPAGQWLLGLLRRVGGTTRPP